MVVFVEVSGAFDGVISQRKMKTIVIPIPRAPATQISRPQSNSTAGQSVLAIGGGREYDNSVRGKVTKTTPSGNRTTVPPTWLESLPRIQLISPGGWSNKSTGGAIFVPSPPKTGTNL